MTATIDHRPGTFDRVDRVKAAVNEPALAGDDRLWILGGPLTATLHPAGGPAWTVTVPRGFVTDGASVPWTIQTVTGWRPWDEPQRWGAIVHDWLYSCNGRPVTGHPDLGILPAVAKRDADRAFRAVLRAAGAHPVRYTAMYLAVHLFAGSAYRSDQATGPTVRV
jgi:hypothetical protein